MITQTARSGDGSFRGVGENQLRSVDYEKSYGVLNAYPVTSNSVRSVYQYHSLLNLFNT